jgi:hypothetical protein
MTGQGDSTRNAPAIGPLPSPTRGVGVRRPRTSLIDAEWDWLARRFDDGGSDGAHGSAPRHSDTWPPPPFSPDAPVGREEPKRSLPVELVGAEVPPLWVVALARSVWGLLATALFCFLAGAYSARSAAAILAPQEMTRLTCPPVIQSRPTPSETPSPSQIVAAAPNTIIAELSPPPSPAKHAPSKSKLKPTALARRVANAAPPPGKKRSPASLQLSDNRYRRATETESR